VIDAKDAQARAESHLADSRAVLAQLEEAAAGETAAADQLVASFRGSTAEVVETSMPSPMEIEAARLAVQRAEGAGEQLPGEVAAAARELALAQHRVGLCVLDVLKSELLAIARKVEEHERAAAVLRSNLDAAGYVTANLRRRRNWPGRIFTTTMRAALHPTPPARPPAPSVDWEAFIAKLYDYPEAELG
jgi:hypothetical protein